MNTRHDSEASLEARLRADARRLQVAPPDGLEQRISAAVWRERDTVRQAPRARPRQRAWRLFSPALAGLLTSACAVALVVLWPERAARDDIQAEDIQYLVTTVESLPGRLAAVELPTSAPLPVSGALTREIEGVRADARNALGFLAANFLPSQVLAGDTTPAAAQES